jgi:hypothetical protein
MDRHFKIRSLKGIADAAKIAKGVEKIPVFTKDKNEDGSFVQNKQERVLFVVKDKPTGVKLLTAIQRKLENIEDSALLEGMKKLSISGYHTIKFMEEKSFDGLLTNYDNGFAGKLSSVTSVYRVDY